MYTQTHTHLKFSALLYTHNQCLKSPLDVTQATTKKSTGSKTYWIFIFPSRHSHLLLFPISAHETIIHSGENPRSQGQVLLFPQGLLVLPIYSLIRPIFSLSLSSSHLTPATKSIISHWRPARGSQPALLTATVDPYNLFST